MSFYVPIDNPTEIQKQVLISSKKIIGVLKSYEEYRKVREEKLVQILEFKKVLDELSVLNKKLSDKLPKTSAPKVKVEKEKPVKVEKKHLAALEKELADIEKRLQKLD